jgi:hypothetical protein
MSQSFSQLETRHVGNIVVMLKRVTQMVVICQTDKAPTFFSFPDSLDVLLDRHRLHPSGMVRRSYVYLVMLL